MPMWDIQGADRATGRDVRRSIEAPTEEAARREAGIIGILVSSVHRSALDQLAYYAQPPAPQSSRTRLTPPPEYPGIIGGARLLGFMGGIYGLFGIIFFIFALAILALILWDISHGNEVSVPAYRIFGALSLGVSLITLYGLLRMAASVSRAISDIARDTHEISQRLRRDE